MKTYGQVDIQVGSKVSLVVSKVLLNHVTYFFIPYISPRIQCTAHNVAIQFCKLTGKFKSEHSR
jgi:hypothetical protein